MNIKNEVNGLKQNADGVLNKAIIFITLILFGYCYFGSFSFFNNAFAGAQDVAYFKIIYHNLMAFVLFFAIGLIYTKFVIKAPLKNMGLGLGKVKLGLIFCAIATVILPLLAITCAFNADMVATYPLIDFKVYGGWYIVLYFASYLLYYIGWEYLFRGMGFFSGEKKLGPLGAILIITMVSALIHTSIGGFGKPMTETLAAIVAGLAFGFVAYKTRSIWYGVYMHVLIGFLTDLFITILA